MKRKILTLLLCLSLCLSLVPAALAADENTYTVEQRLETDLCSVILEWKPIGGEDYTRDYRLRLVYPEGESKQLLLPSTTISRDNLSFAPTDRSPDLLTLSDDGCTLTYLYRFEDKLVSPYYGTTLHEAGIYTYTVELASGELGVIYTEPFVPPTGDAVFDDVPAGSWYAKGVRTCAEKGIMVGTGEGIFSPNAVLTDAECLTLALRLYDMQRGGSGQLLKAPEDWGKITLTIEGGEQVSGYPGRFYEGWYRFSTSTAGRPNPKLALSLESDEERVWAEAQSGKAATITAGGVSTPGTVELSWTPNFSSALYFQPDDGSDRDRRGVINATSYCNGLYPGTDKWWRDAVYTLSLLPERLPSADRLPLFDLLVTSLQNYPQGPKTASRSMFAYSLADTAGELEKLYTVDDLPDLKWNEWNRAIQNLYEGGVLTGVDEYGRCDEGGVLTRAQAAVMVARVLDVSQRVQTPPKALPSDGYTLTKLADSYGESQYPLCFYTTENGESRILALDGSSIADLNPHTTGWQQEGEYLLLYEGTEDSYESSPTLLDRNVKVVVPPWQYMELHPTPDGTAIMAERGLSGLESWYLLSPEGEPVEELGLDLTWGYNEGVCPWEDPETGLCGYVDKTGTWVIPPQWNMAYHFQNGYALVGTSIPDRESWEYQYTLIDHRGKELFPVQEYDTQYYLYNSPGYEGGYLFYFRNLDGKGFYLNAAGELVPAPKYCDEEKYQNGYFAQDGIYYDLTGTPVSRKFDWCGKLDTQGRGFVGLDDAIYRIELNP